MKLVFDTSGKDFSAQLIGEFRQVSKPHLQWENQGYDEKFPVSTCLALKTLLISSEIKLKPQSFTGMNLLETFLLY